MFVAQQASRFSDLHELSGLEWPQEDQFYSAGTTVPISVGASQYDWSISNVTVTANASTAVTLTAPPPFSSVWQENSPGHYVLQAHATDTGGYIGTSSSAAIDIVGSGGSLSESVGQIDSSLDLTAEGTADWIVFGPTNYSQGYVTSSRKNDVIPQISNFTLIGTLTSNSWVSGGFFSFEDGTPDTQETNIGPTTYVGGTGSGIQFTVAADSTPRTLRLYGTLAGGLPGWLKLKAYLSDGSAAPVIDKTLAPITSDVETYYAINFSAASSGQTLTIQLTLIGDGALFVNAATLSGPPVPKPPQVNSIQPAIGVAGDPFVMSGSSFTPTQGTVTFNGISAVVSSWTDTEIDGFVPLGVTTGSVQVVNAAGSSNTDAVFTVRPLIASITPSIGLIGVPVLLTGSGFGANQALGTVTFNGTAAQAQSWSDTAIQVQVPSGATTGSVTVAVGTALSNSAPFTILSGSQSAPVLKDRVDDSLSPVTLSDPVNLDWIVWGTDGQTAAATRKANSQMINVSTTVAGSPVMVSTGRVQYNWTGGVPVASGNANVAGITSGGFQITAPATTAVQTLKVYLCAWGGSQLTASISDGSSPSISDNSVNGPSYVGEEKVYSVDFRAAAPGQTLSLVITGPGGVILEAAVLQPHLPEVSILLPTDGQSFLSPADIGLGFSATQFDSAIAIVGANANQLQISQISSTPYIAEWQPKPGHYLLQGTATDTSGQTGSSATVQVDVIGSGGLLAGSASTPPQNTNSWGSTTDLTVEGTADWIIFAPRESWSYVANPSNFSGIVRKAGVSAQISGSTPIGQGNFSSSCGGPMFFVFEDGTPDVQETMNMDCGLSAAGAGGGYQFTVSADTTMRTLRLYVESDGGAGKLKTFLSDGSAPVLVDRSIQATANNYAVSAVYTIQFQAASANQLLTVQWVGDGVPTPQDQWKNVLMYAATLSGAAVATAPQITSVSPNSGSSGSIISIKGSAFGALQGSGSYISIGNVQAQVFSWSESEVDAVVPNGVCAGPIVVTANGLTSNPADFTIPVQVAVIPSSAGLIVGQSLQLDAVNANCSAPLSGATWSLTPNTGVATLSSDAQPVLTASGVGAVTVAATLGGYIGSATFQVTALDVAPPPTSAPPSIPTAYASSVTLTNSLGVATTYNSSYVGGQRLITDSDGPGCSTCDIRNVFHYTYDSQGNLASQIDALGHVTYATYDGFGNLLTSSVQSSAGEYATTSFIYNSFGEVLSVTNPLGNTTSNAYDDFGNLLSVSSPAPDSNTSPGVTRFTYDPKGELTQITDPLGNVSKVAYTSVGLIQSITDARGSTTSYEYDGHGNRTLVVDASGNRTAFSYDAGDRLIGIVYPDQTTASFTYDYRGRRTSVTDQNGNATNYSYDDADRLIAVTDPAQHTTAYVYDTEDNLLSITDANGNSTSFNHDDFGRVIQTTFPSGMAEYYTYDLIGNMLSKKDRKGQTIQYVYDALNRLTSKQYPDSTTAEYTYDLVGRILNVSDPTGSYGFAYDNMGRLLSSTTQYTFLPGQTLANSYTYDAASNRTGLTAADGSTNRYVYDSANRLTTLNNSWAGQFGFSYDAINRRTQMTRPNGTSTTYNYDSLSRLLGVLHGGGDGAKYGYDSAGNRTSKQNLLTGMTENYSYDAIYELTRVVQGASTTASYNYDPVGNRLASLGMSPYQYDVSNRLSSVPAATYSYDSNGNLLSKTNATGTTQYAWDYENRLISAVVPQPDGSTPIIRFQYDPFGRRIQKSSPSRTRYYVYDGANMVAELNTSGGVIASYTQGLGVDEHLAMRRGATVAYYQADALGSITSLSTGDTYTYDSFGNITSSTGNIINPYRFTGREWDAETGLYYYRARYYDPSIGRFLSEDPSGFDGDGLNFYVYVRNDPIDFTDPSGLIRYNHNPPVTVPPSGYTLGALQCLENCLRCRTNNPRLNLMVTGGAEGSGHKGRSWHYVGSAVDIWTGNPVSTSDVFACATSCGFMAGQLEASRHHWHLQLAPGNGVPPISGQKQSGKCGCQGN